jgi:ribosomal protein L11 methyltransferase
VRPSVSGVDGWTGPATPLVLANLLAAAHVTLASTLAARVAPGGNLIAGGLLAHEVPVVTGVFAAEGCWLVELAEDDGWAALLLRRGG